MIRGEDIHRQLSKELLMAGECRARLQTMGGEVDRLYARKVQGVGQREK